MATNHAGTNCTYLAALSEHIRINYNEQFFNYHILTKSGLPKLPDPVPEPDISGLGVRLLPFSYF